MLFEKFVNCLFESLQILSVFSHVISSVNLKTIWSNMSCTTVVYLFTFLWQNVSNSCFNIPRRVSLFFHWKKQWTLIIHIFARWIYARLSCVMFPENVLAVLSFGDMFIELYFVNRSFNECWLRRKLVAFLNVPNFDHFEVTSR